ncbi:MAG: hypothetical protein QM813_19735 [Verrucomicrobiota bacterium]
MKKLLVTWGGLFVICAALAGPVTNQPTVVLVVGASGEPEYGSNFVQQVQLWDKVCDRAEAQVVRIGFSPTNELADRERLKQVVAMEQTNNVALVVDSLNRPWDVQWQRSALQSSRTGCF